MKLLIEEIIKNRYDNTSLNSNEVFEYYKNKTGGVLDSGVTFISDLNSKDNSADVFLVKQVEKDKFETIYSKNVQLNGEQAVFVNDATEGIQITTIFNLSE